jgi:hypothetical protein
MADYRFKISPIPASELELFRDASAEEVRDRDGRVILSGDVEWSPEEGAVYREGERVVLTDREYALFARLC